MIYKHFITEELEKLKSEIELMDFDFGDYYDDTNTIIEMVSKVIDDRISELKGENNTSEQTDIEFNHKAFYEYLLNVINPNEMENYRSMFLSSGEIVN